MFGGYEFGRPAFGDFLPPEVIPPGPDWITVAVSATWPRVVALTVAAPGAAVTTTWPRVVTLDVDVPTTTVTAGWPRVIDVRVDE